MYLPRTCVSFIVRGPILVKMSYAYVGELGHLRLYVGREGKYVGNCFGGG